MKILCALTYYRPYTSGLTIYAERLARALVKRGHEVTVLTMRYSKELPARETVDGVQIVRAGVLFRVSKGVISPSIGLLATKLAMSHDALILHLPQFDAAGISLRGKIFGRPTILTYHCDLQLPPGLFNLAVNQVVHFMNHCAATFANRIVSYTSDYACNSPFISRYMQRVAIIPPPVELPEAAAEDVRRFEEGNALPVGRPRIAMAARFAAEKGVEVLLDAFEKVLPKHPSASIVFAGQYQDVLGEGEYYRRLEPRISALIAKGQWKFVGVLPPGQMAAFFKCTDVLVVPSLNSTESFGLVQIEAMMNGVPAVASNLPGVRQPVEITGMGGIAEIGNAGSLAEAINRVLDRQYTVKMSPADIRAYFSPDSIAAKYEQLIGEIAGVQ